MQEVSHDRSVKVRGGPAAASRLGRQAPLGDGWRVSPGALPVPAVQRGGPGAGALLGHPTASRGVHIRRLIGR